MRPARRPSTRRALRALLAAAVAAGTSSAGPAAAAASGLRLAGTFSMQGTITVASGVYGESVGLHVPRIWTFIPQCPVGACAKVTLRRRRSPRHVADTLVLRRRARGRYVGTGRFWVPVLCAGRMIGYGGLATERITVNVTQAVAAGTGQLATALNASYVNSGRRNLTRCPGSLGRDAAYYTGELVAPTPAAIGSPATLNPRVAAPRSRRSAVGHALTVRAVLARWRLPVARYRTMAVANDHYVFLLGGIDAAGATVDGVYRLDPARRTAKLAGRLATPTHGAAGLLLGRRVFVFGGAGPPVYDLVQQYTPAAARTRVVAHLPAQRADLAAAVVGRRVVVAAGFDGVGPLDTVLATTDERHFRTLAHLPVAVRYPAVAAVGNSVYLFGGLLSGGEYTGTFTRDIQRINVSTVRASVVGRLPAPYAHAMATVRGGQVFILGGSTPAGSSNAILRFDPATRAVTRAGTLPEHVADGGVATIGDTTYVVGGVNGGPLTTVCIVRIR